MVVVVVVVVVAVVGSVVTAVRVLEKVMISDRVRCQLIPDDLDLVLPGCAAEMGTGVGRGNGLVRETGSAGR